MAYPSYTYTFTNGSLASGSYVQQDFTDILNGISDGTKDIYVSSIVTTGRVGVGGAGASAGVYLSSGLGAYLSGTTNRGIWSEPRFSPSVATVAANAVEADLRTDGSGGTLAIGRAFHAAAADPGDTVTRLINYGGVAQTAGATGNAFLADNATFTGNVFIHQTGTTASTFGGTVNLASGSVSSTAWTTGSSTLAVGGATTLSALTATRLVATDGSKVLTSLTYASANTASAMVQRDGSGNFSAGTITANLTGNASGTAATFTGALTGDVTSSGMATTAAATQANITTLSNSGGVTVSNTFTAGSASLAGTHTFTNSAAAVTTPLIDLPNGKSAIQLGGDANAATRTNTTNKETRIQMYHYTNASTPWTVIYPQSTVSANLINFGGGTGQLNAATAIDFYTAASTTTTTGTRRMTITTAGSVAIGSSIATTATDGFLYIPSCAGAPTGVPTTIGSAVAMVYDTTNNKFYVYNGAWKGVVLS